MSAPLQYASHTAATTAAQDPPSPDAADGRKRKRCGGLPRAAHACDSCRKRKSKCDQEQPCSSCVKHSFECAYRPRGVRTKSEPIIEAASDNVALNKANDGRHRPLLAPASQSYADAVASLASPFVHIAAAPGLPKPGDRISTERGHQALPHRAPPQGESPSHRQSIPGAQSEPDTDSLGGLNAHTQGHEFYGPMGAFSFLSRLRLKALSEAGVTSDSPKPKGRRGSRNLEDISIVNLLHSSDYPSASESTQRDSQALTQARTSSSAAFRGYAESMSSLTDASKWYRSLPQAVEVEQECAKLYFQNLHNIHPILEPSAFLLRCEKDIWTPVLLGKSLSSFRTNAHSFLALYNAVLAIGAITAGDQSSLVWQQTTEFLNLAETACGMRSNSATYPPLRLARLFFEKSKAMLGDVFDSCSFEGAQTLFLMSVFCQNALKPHSCYMYSGMAARASLAIGVPNRTDVGSETAAMLWWGLYSHEIEMCASAGRESALGEPARYAVSLPTGPTNNSGRDMISCMVSLAQLLNEVYVEIYLPQSHDRLPAKSTKAQDLDIQLLQWRASLPASLNLHTISLTEPEQVTKQKIVLRLRFFNARILLHRPFLIAAANPRHRNNFGLHVELCVNASRETISILYDAYMHRPYFRTWWYNCTYALYASMILLYVVLTRLHLDPAEDLLRDAEKSLEIFGTMKMVAVARKCCEITQEVLDIARKSIARRAMSERKLPPLTPRPQDQALPSPGAGTGAAHDTMDLGQDDVYTNLLDSNLLSNFMDFDGSNGWLDGSAGAFSADQVYEGLASFNMANYGVLDYVT